MKLNSKNYTKIIYVLLTISFLRSELLVAGTDDAYTPNDVLLFFQNPDGSTGKLQVVYYSLGSAAAVFREAATPNSSTFGKTIALGNINSILTSTYGADWTGLRSTIHAGATGQNGATSALSSSITSGDYARTVYVTKTRNGAGTVGEPNSGSPLFDPAQTAVASLIAGANNIAGMTQPGVVAFADTTLESNNPFSNGNPSTAYGTLAGGIQGPVGTTTSYANLNAVLLLDLYRVTKTTGTNANSPTLWHIANTISPTYSNNSYPASNGARADFLGTIAVSANGAVNFVAKGWSEALDTPQIISSATAAGTVGISFSYQIAASNSPTEYAATLSQSTGAATVNLSINPATGVISGTPVNEGVAAIPIFATNSNGTGSASLTLTIVSSADPTPTPTQTPTPAPTGPAVTILDISSWTRPSWSRSLYSTSSATSVENGVSSSTKTSKKSKAKKSRDKGKSTDKKGNRKKKKSR